MGQPRIILNSSDSKIQHYRNKEVVNQDKLRERLFKKVSTVPCAV